MIPNFLMADVKLYNFRFPTGEKILILLEDILDQDPCNHTHCCW